MTSPRLSIDMDVRLPENRLPIDSVFVERCLEAAAVVVDESGEVSVSFVTDEEIHRLNRDYRSVDRPTDVLSFSMLEGEDVPMGQEDRVLGDIVVSVPTASRQATDYGHSVERELGFLLVHGFLHLVGYDHDTPEAERAMFTLQDQIFAQLGLAREHINRDVDG